MTNIRLPSVSVVITGFNSADTIRRAVDSVRVQTFTDFEIVFVDDASTDNTVNVVEAMDEPRLRIVRNLENRGIGGAKNAGVDVARGQFIAFLDSDDTWEPQKLALQFERLQKNSAGRPLSFTSYWVHRAGTDRGLPRQPRLYGSWLKSVLSGEHLCLGSTFFGARSLFETVGPFDESLRRRQDGDWILRYFEQWDDILFLDEPLAHIFNTGFPRPDLVERSANNLYEKHAVALRTRDTALAQLFRSSLNFEIAVSEFRSGQRAAAGKRMFDTLATNPAFASYLARRIGRKLIQGDPT